METTQLNYRLDVTLRLVDLRIINSSLYRHQDQKVKETSSVV